MRRPLRVGAHGRTARRADDAETTTDLGDSDASGVVTGSDWTGSDWVPLISLRDRRGGLTRTHDGSIDRSSLGAWHIASLSLSLSHIS